MGSLTVLGALAAYLGLIYVMYGTVLVGHEAGLRRADTSKAYTLYGPQDRPRPVAVELTGSLYRQKRAEELNDPAFDFYADDDAELP